MFLDPNTTAIQHVLTFHSLIQSFSLSSSSLSSLDNNTHLRLPPSSLRDLGGVMAGKTKQPTLPTSYYPAPHDYTLPSMLNSNTARFSTSNLPSVLDQYVIQRRHNPGPKYLLDQYRKNRNISMGQATRPIFRRNAGSDTPGKNKIT